MVKINRYLTFGFFAYNSTKQKLEVYAFLVADIYGDFREIMSIYMYSLPPLTRQRKGNEYPVELAGVELAREKAKLFNSVQFLSKDVFLKRVSRSLNFLHGQ